MIVIPQAVYDQLRHHGETAYPHECCGILVGTHNGREKAVTSAIAIENASNHPHNHYEIAPLDLIRVERESRAAGLEIVGFYHSHPDHPAHWSSTDLGEAHWLGCSYVITSVEKGIASVTNAFNLAGGLEEEKHFVAEEIQLL